MVSRAVGVSLPWNSSAVTFAVSEGLRPPLGMIDPDSAISVSSITETPP